MGAGLIARSLLLIAIPLALSSCGLAPTRPAPAAPSVSSAPTVAPTSAAAITHLLSRITFGPRPGDLERVRSIGGPAYLEQQLHPERIDDAPTEEVVRALPTLNLSIAELLQQYPRPDPTLRARARAGEMSGQEPATMTPPERRPARIVSELAAAKLARAVMSDRQLQEVMVDFWFNHFNVSADKGVVRWYVTAYERDAIRPHALGTFRDLVRATAAHPAMLWYLDNWASTRADFVIPQGPNQGRTAGLNENYARELMELHTVGVDGGYTQGDVREVARAFTGWTNPRTRFGESMRQIGQLIRADVGLEIAFTDVGGWDTHVGQGNERGQLAVRLQDFATTLAAFARDLGDRMADVVVLTTSEFGRTVSENGNRGTDHGHATAMLVTGGTTQGGRVYGRWPGLRVDQRFEGRDLAVTTDFRSLFSEVAAQHLGAPPAAPIFPGWMPRASLGLFS